MKYRGANIRLLKQPKRDDLELLFDYLQGKGCNAVALNTIHYICTSSEGGAHLTWPQSGWYPHHSLVYPDWQQLPHMVGETTDIARVWGIMESALDRGMRVMLKPMVDPQWTHGWFGGWRGAVAIPPELYENFLLHYSNFLRPYAELAHDYDCDLCLGTEMAQLTRDHGYAFWQEQINLLNQAEIYPSVTYAANWGHLDDPGAEYKLVEGLYNEENYDLTQFCWDEYRPYQDFEAARVGMGGVALEVKRLRESTGRMVVLSEVGWPNRDYALQEPWGRDDHGGEVTYAYSQPLWELFMEILAPALDGYYVWEAGGEGSHNIAMTPIADIVFKE